MGLFGGRTGVAEVTVEGVLDGVSPVEAEGTGTGVTLDVDGGDVEDEETLLFVRCCLLYSAKMP